MQKLASSKARPFNSRYFVVSFQPFAGRGGWRAPSRLRAAFSALCLSELFFLMAAKEAHTSV
jgi:hypothetical protein